VVLGFSSSCLKNEICSPYIIDLQAGIYNFSESDGIIDTIPSKIDLDTLYGITLEDNYLLLNSTDTETLNFPLNDASTECSFILSFGHTKDTIHFIYEKHLLFNSVKCGVSYTYSIINIAYSTNLLQEIILINSEIDVNSAENIQLVF
jgi:hypothetical protein